VVGQLGGFAKGFGSGVKNIVVGAAKGVASLAGGGYKLATDPAARQKAMVAGRNLVNSAQVYGSQVRQNPRKALRDGQAGISAMHNQFNAARENAAARGQSAEFWGTATAEIGTLVVPGGAFVKGARATSVASGLSKAARVITSPVAKATRAAISVLPCDKIVKSARVAATLPKRALDASRIAAGARKVEKVATPLMKKLANDHGGKLRGLRYRLKSEPSLRRKLMDGPPSRINDALRYTMTAKSTNLGRVSKSVLSDLEKQGYQVTKLANTLNNKAAPYKGINVTLRAKTGDLMELQFHTPESFFVKQRINHKLYEESRILDRNSPRNQELLQRMIENSNRIQPVPNLPKSMKKRS
jgi:hypothetical protein